MTSDQIALHHAGHDLADLRGWVCNLTLAVDTLLSDAEDALALLAVDPMATGLALRRVQRAREALQAARRDQLAALETAGVQP